ncbi:hypothetical protein FDUTEX481_03624 [Tolypothrix sp. PCC 7601]|nr:hypothetical protein FDUTEX481_03624 [Tolypothrix sp. PCC 7601]
MDDLCKFLSFLNSFSGQGKRLFFISFRSFSTNIQTMIHRFRENICANLREIQQCLL